MSLLDGLDADHIAGGAAAWFVAMAAWNFNRALFPEAPSWLVIGALALVGVLLAEVAR